MRRKGKVHPSPPPSSSTSAAASSSSSPVSSVSEVSTPSLSTNKNALSFLKLLPAAILAILSILSSEDREVLAYMISRSIKSTNFPSIQEISKKKSKKLGSITTPHKSPTFDCECFGCYTSYWFRWDSSPNRLIIHQAIEAFEEEYLFYNQEKLLYNGKNKHNKKKDKLGRRGFGKMSDFIAFIQSPEFQELVFFDKVSSPAAEIPPQSEVLPDADMVVSESRKSVELLNEVNLNKDVKNQESPEHEVVAQRGVYGGGGGGGGNNEKGLARKVLPDVLGLFSSRLWNLWGPNV